MERNKNMKVRTQSLAIVGLMTLAACSFADSPCSDCAVKIGKAWKVLKCEAKWSHDITDFRVDTGNKDYNGREVNVIVFKGTTPSETPVPPRKVKCRSVKDKNRTWIELTNLNIKQANYTQSLVVELVEKQPGSGDLILLQTQLFINPKIKKKK